MDHALKEHTKELSPNMKYLNKHTLAVLGDNAPTQVIAGRWELDKYLHVKRTKANPEKITVVIPWNHMTTFDWKLAAEFSGDSDWSEAEWKASKHIGPFFGAEFVKFIFMEGQLQAVRYYFPSRGNCGYGYKGFGLSDAEKKGVETYFLEVENDDEGPWVENDDEEQWGGPYIYERKKMN
jgi:hypothetical protein